MKKVLASLGIGNATVDTVLPSQTVTQGEPVDATVNIVGGEAEQAVGTIRFEVETRYRTDEGYREIDIDRVTIAEGLTIEPGQEETREVTIDVPYQTPVTVGGVDVWIETELDIDLAVDPEDKDYLDVQPEPRLQAVFDVMEDLGLSLRTAECEADPYGRYTSGRRFIQEFEFRPSGGPFQGEVDEIELVANPTPASLELYVEVDRNAGLLSEMADTDERTVRTTIESTDPPVVRDQLESLIEQRI